nr:13502_t:CDS:2 [Entrophospora candida]
MVWPSSEEFVSKLPNIVIWTHWTVQICQCDFVTSCPIPILIRHLDPDIGHNLDILDIWTDLPTLDQNDWEVKNPKTNGTVKQKNAYQSLNVACKELREM